MSKMFGEAKKSMKAYVITAIAVFLTIGCSSMDHAKDSKAEPYLRNPRIFSIGCSSGDHAEDSSMVATCAVEVPVFKKQWVPSSGRSRGVVKRVAPSLVTELEEKGLLYGAPLFIRIFKEERELEVWLKDKERFALFRTYPIASCSGELGPKLRKGDRQAPEGFYFVTPKRMNPNSRFHLSFNLGYPNSYDRAHGRTGGALMVHGSNVSIGCFAMTDVKIEEIYTLADAALRNGQSFFRVHCFPFRMTDSNMKRHTRSKWIEFWKNIKKGYDHFKVNGVPPNVVMKNGKYVFEKQ